MELVFAYSHRGMVDSCGATDRPVHRTLNLIPQARVVRQLQLQLPLLQGRAWGARAPMTPLRGARVTRKLPAKCAQRGDSARRWGHQVVSLVPMVSFARTSTRLQMAVLRRRMSRHKQANVPSVPRVSTQEVAHVGVAVHLRVRAKATRAVNGACADFMPRVQLPVVPAQ